MYKFNYFVWFFIKISNYTKMFIFFYLLIVYLDKETANGTNIYQNISWNEDKHEHRDHYCNENEVKVIAHTPSEYNKLVIWNGLELHGLCQDEKYIDRWRLNQVFFFQA